ncbi:MAG: YbaB/EbfC family nucleoid-associated protein [Spirosomataceae bacterium]
MFDMLGMMGKVKEMQTKMQEAQNQLAEVEATGEAGAGMVQVIVNGKKQIKSIQIDPTLVDASQLPILQDLLVAAINKAQENAEEIAKEHLAKATEGLLPSIPGMDLGSLFNK